MKKGIWKQRGMKKYENVNLYTKYAYIKKVGSGEVDSINWFRLQY